MQNYIQPRNGVDTQKVQKNLDAANKELQENGVYFQAEFQSLGSMIVEINIEWGDWKHEHGLADYIMNKHGFKKTDEVVTEEDGDDSYSSIHYYLPIDS